MNKFLHRRNLYLEEEMLGISKKGSWKRKYKAGKWQKAVELHNHLYSENAQYLERKRERKGESTCHVAEFGLKLNSTAG